jgi:hypothetical protein
MQLGYCSVFTSSSAQIDVLGMGFAGTGGDKKARLQAIESRENHYVRTCSDKIQNGGNSAKGDVEKL